MCSLNANQVRFRMKGSAQISFETEAQGNTEMAYYCTWQTQKQKHTHNHLHCLGQLLEKPVMI